MMPVAASMRNMRHAVTPAVRRTMQAQVPARVVQRMGAVRAVASKADDPIHVVGISGSSRKGSVNTGLLRTAAKHLPAGVTLEIVDISGLPTYNDDMWKGGSDESVLPEAIRTFRQKTLKADAILFACPEYNFNVTSALKAAIDWGCCGRGANVFDSKPAAIMGAGGGAGTARAQMALRTSGIYLNLHFVNGPELMIKRFEMPAAFDAATGDLKDAALEGFVKAKVEALVAWARRIKH